MQIAIVEDRECDGRELIGMLNSYFRKKNMTAAWKRYASGREFLDSYSPGQYDLIFLDIYMEGINGMDTAREIRRTDSSCSLIFFTTSYVHAVESYEVDAAYYLTKPLKKEALEKALDIVCCPLEKNSQYVTFTVKGNLKTNILLKDILYVDCIARHTYVHLPNRQVMVYESIASVLNTLARESRFLSCNRNIMVNMDWVEHMLSDEILLKNNVHVPIRQRGRKALKKAFLEYSLKDLRREEDI